MLKNILAIFFVLVFSVPLEHAAKPKAWLLMMSVNSAETREEDRYVPEALAISKSFQNGLAPFYDIQERHLYYEDCTRSNCLTALKHLSPAQKDLVIVYVGCHGREVKDKGFGYYTSDGKVFASEVREILNKLNAPVLLIVDTCHSGALLNEQFSETISVICSCLSKEYAGTWELTVALLEALEGKADYDGDGIVDLEELRKYVVERLPELAGKQHPVLSKDSLKLPLFKVAV